jgi:curved DNA-binding protein CbpA
MAPARALAVALAACCLAAGARLFYDVLGVEPAADTGAIKKAYRQLALVLHPDKLGPGASPADVERFQRLAAAYETLVEPALARGDMVLADRFTDASFAYQGGGRSFDATVLTQLEAWVQTDTATGQLVQPDLTLWFDLPPAVAAQRRAVARDADRLEREDLTFFERVRAGYALRAANAPRRFMRIDADQSRDAVWAAVHQAVLGTGATGQGG